MVSISLQDGTKEGHNDPQNPSLIDLCSKLCTKAQTIMLGTFPGSIPLLQGWVLLTEITPYVFFINQDNSWVFVFYKSPSRFVILPDGKIMS